MTIDDIRRLYAYNVWANDEMVEALRSVGDEGLSSEVESSYRSLLATFEHIVGAEWIWMERLRGESPTGLLSPNQSFDTLETLLTLVESEREKYLENLNPDDLTRPLTYRNIAGTEYTNLLREILVHVVNHSSYHRGQLATLLRQAGVTPPSTDYIVWVRLHQTEDS